MLFKSSYLTSRVGRNLELKNLQHCNASKNLAPPFCGPAKKASWLHAHRNQKNPKYKSTVRGPNLAPANRLVSVFTGFHPPPVQSDICPSTVRLNKSPLSPPIAPKTSEVERGSRTGKERKPGFKLLLTKMVLFREGTRVFSLWPCDG